MKREDVPEYNAKDRLGDLRVSLLKHVPNIEVTYGDDRLAIEHESGCALVARYYMPMADNPFQDRIGIFDATKADAGGNVDLAICGFRDWIYRIRQLPGFVKGACGIRPLTVIVSDLDRRSDGTFFMPLRHDVYPC